MTTYPSEMTLHKITRLTREEINALGTKEIQKLLVYLLHELDHRERVNARKVIWGIADAAFQNEKTLKALKRYVSGTVFIGNNVPDREVELEIIALSIIDKGIEHILNQLQGEENAIDCKLLHTDSLVGYLMRIARHHNILRNAQSRTTVMLCPTKESVKQIDNSTDDEELDKDDASPVVAKAQDKQPREKPYRVFAAAVEESAVKDSETDLVPVRSPEYLRGVSGLYMEDIEDLRLAERLLHLEDGHKLILLLTLLYGKVTVADFDEAVLICKFSEDFDPLPYRRRLRLREKDKVAKKGALASGLSITDIASILDVSEPTARKRIQEAEDALNNPGLHMHRCKLRIASKRGTMTRRFRPKQKRANPPRLAGK